MERSFRWSANRVTAPSRPARERVIIIVGVQGGEILTCFHDGRYYSTVFKIGEGLIGQVISPQSQEKPTETTETTENTGKRLSATNFANLDERDFTFDQTCSSFWIIYGRYLIRMGNNMEFARPFASPKPAQGDNRLHWDFTGIAPAMMELGGE